MHVYTGLDLSRKHLAVDIFSAAPSLPGRTRVSARGLMFEWCVSAGTPTSCGVALSVWYALCE